MKFRYNKQDGIKDCGVCVLHNIIRYYGGNINFEKLRNEMCTNKEGTSIFHIVEAANKYGLKSKSYRCELNDLCNLNFPLVAHIMVENKYPHFVIIKKIEDYDVYLFDPIRGDIKYSLENFEKEWSNVIITFEKTENIINEKTEYKTYLLNILKDNKKIIFIISFISIISTFISALNSIYLQSLLDNLNNTQSIFIIFLILMIIKIILDYIKNNFIIKFNMDIDSKLMSDIYKHILFLPIKYHHSRPAGDIVSRIYDLYYIKDFINQLSFKIIIDIILAIIISIFLFVINKVLFLITILMTLFFISIYMLFRNKINNLISLNHEDESKVNSILVENLIGIDTIKNLNREDIFLDNQNKVYNSFLFNNQKLNSIYNLYNSIEEFIVSNGIIISLFIGSIFIINGNLTVGTLASFNLLLINYYNSIRSILSVDNLIINSKNAYKRINELFNIEEEKEEETQEFKSSIKFKRLSYSYNNYHNNLDNFNLEINKNDYVLITGKSGIGKSTIFKLLTKQIKCKDNMIFLDNKDINKFSSKYLKEKICYVSQKEYIFTDTIENNIKLYNNTSKEKLDKVLKITMVDKILEKRNIDLNYILEENGHNLSGGERQKILLARTLLTDKEFIVLDETMNEIDIDSERKIINRIKTEYNKTLVLISHRKDNKDLFNKCIEIK